LKFIKSIRITLLNKLYKSSFIQVNIQQVRQAMANAMDQETLKKLAAEVKKTVEEKDCCKWITDENTMVCEPCLMFAICPERPQKYAQYYRSNFCTFNIR
jgi:hypothetical protein